MKKVEHKDDKNVNISKQENSKSSVSIIIETT